MLQCIVAADATSVAAGQLSAAVRDSISALIQRLPDVVRWTGVPLATSFTCATERPLPAPEAGGPCYARCYRDRHLHVSRAALRHALLSAVHGACAQPVELIPSGGAESECARSCEIVDLPVVCVAHSGARLAVQIYFDAPAATT